ncbi:hypothetical protein N7456_004043 [Penicillium angulare]|uniref:Uncharacterized protein n=1 Tax=Penicillium angulare TaxID=116970 RepID=A0A9W9KJ80_9EURO|nr:hypothetical protein N7456_004043 [Penicillium angulare]
MRFTSDAQSCRTCYYKHRKCNRKRPGEPLNIPTTHSGNERSFIAVYAQRGYQDGRQPSDPTPPAAFIQPSKSPELGSKHQKKAHDQYWTSTRWRYQQCLSSE